MSQFNDELNAARAQMDAAEQEYGDGEGLSGGEKVQIHLNLLQAMRDVQDADSLLFE